MEYGVPWILSDSERRELDRIKFAGAHRFNAACRAIGVSSLNELREWIISNQPNTDRLLAKACRDTYNLGAKSREKIIAWADSSYSPTRSNLESRIARLKAELAEAESKLESLG